MNYAAKRVLWLAVLVSSSMIVMGQVPTAQIGGTITDPSGSVIAGAEVRLKNESTGIETKAAVNSEGRYTALALPAGSYVITVSSTGFKTKSVTGVNLSVGQTARLDIGLELGEITDQVTVAGEAPLLQSEGAAVGTVVTQKQLVELPLNGRSFVTLATLAPGASDGLSNSYQKLVFGKRAEYSVIQANGIRSEFTQTSIDGINTQTNDRHWTSAIYPSVDMISEVKSETSNYSSEFSGGGGVMLNVVTKSGTNQFHGSLFEFGQNRALNARNFFLPANASKPDEKYHQFGGAVGGPIWKDKTHFFVSYQGLRIRQAFVSQTRVPTEKERIGDFSESLGRGRLIFDPNTTVADPNSASGYSRTPFPNNIIPVDRRSPLALKIIEKGYPLPNNPGDPTLNFIQVGATPDDADQWSFRVDHKLSDKNSIFGRWTQDPRERTSLGILPETGSISERKPYTGVLGWNHIFSPRLLSEARFGLTRNVSGGRSFPGDQIIVGPGTDIPLAGLERIPESQRFGLCCFNIGGLASPNYGGSAGTTVENVYQLNDKLSWIRGRHTMNFGGSIRRNEQYSTLASSLLSSRTFRGGFTQNPFGANPTGAIDTGLGDFLLGIHQELSPILQIFPKKNSYWYQHQADFFVDDTIRLTPKLTVSVGLRYTFTESLKEKDNQMAFFDYDTGTLIYPKDAPDITPFAPFIPYKYRKDGPNRLFDMPKDNFQPRLAIAWNPFDTKTIIRAGYAFYTATPSVANLVSIVGVTPYIVTGQRTAVPLFPQDAFRLSDPAVSPDLTQAFANPSLQLGERNFKTPNVQMWNLDIQHQLTPTIVATVGYVGNKGSHFNLVTRPNSPPPGPGALNPRRPYPDFGRIINISWQGISNYHGLQTSIRKTFANGLMFTGAYSFSKALGTADELIELYTFALGLAKNIRANDYGRASFDLTHIFRSSFIYELPVGRGKPFLGNSNPFVNGVLGGWQLAGIVTMQSGQVFTPYGGGDLNAERVQRPDRICDGNLPSGQRTLLRDFDTSCFVNHPPFVDGTAGRNVITQRPLDYLNLAMSKSFRLPINEASRLQFRAEMFNATNTPSFGFPDGGCCGRANFGRLTETERENRVIQLGLKILF